MEDSVSLWGRVRDSRDGDGLGLFEEAVPWPHREEGIPHSQNDPTILAPAESHRTTLGPCGVGWQIQNLPFH